MQRPLDTGAVVIVKVAQLGDQFTQIGLAHLVLRELKFAVGISCCRGPPQVENYFQQFA